MAEREDFIQALRDLADFFEQHPDVPAPRWQQSISLFASYANPKADMAAVARAMGSAAKNYSDELVTLRKPFGEWLELTMHANRDEVCERVVVGTKIIPAEPKRIIPAQPARTEDIVEWHCTPLLEVANG